MSKQQKDKNESVEKKEFLAAKSRRPGIKTDYYLHYFWNDEWNRED